MKVKTPLTIINFKTYKQSSGKNAVKLAKLCEKVAKSLETNIMVAVQAADIEKVASKVKIPVLAQHIDAVEYGSNTGWILAENIKENNAFGTLINHSEHRLKFKEIKKRIEKAKKLKLFTVVCAKDAREGKKLSKLNPDFIAVEPPELIGGNISVATAKPKLIKKSVKKIGDNVLVGAGISSWNDLEVSLKFGAKGILVASGVVKAKDPEKALKYLLAGLK